jgi:hypothetical protein
MVESFQEVAIVWPVSGAEEPVFTDPPLRQNSDTIMAEGRKLNPIKWCLGVVSFFFFF